jgi:RNA polymerase sigma-70 factor (ECF subfamily)
MIPPAGLAELYEQHSDTVYRTALRVTGNPADAEDALQTVFIRVMNQGDRLDPVTTPARYFRRAATNAALDILRRRTTRREAPIDTSFGRASPSGTPQLKEELRQAVARLEPRDAEMFVLRFVEGLSNGELAELYELEKAQVAMRIYRIRQQLQEELK